MRPESGVIFDVAEKRKRLEEIEGLASAPDFWRDQERAQTVLRRRTLLQNDIDLDREFEEIEEEILVHRELLDEGEPVEKELISCLKTYYDKIEQAEVRMMLQGEHDRCNAILTIHPGAGGTESQDWAAMLYRMFLRFAEQQDFKTEVLDYQDGEEAGIKSATLRMAGLFAYGYLKAESGVHRLVRISPFDAAKRRHTSFCGVHVTPEIEDEGVVEIDEKDLRIDTYRSSGAGGQHVNTTDSAIRITHLPTGIVVQCQNERSQHKNKSTAMRVLRSRLAQLQEQKRKDDLDASTATKKDIAWGSQIRSYVLHPYRMVKDHRTQEETGNVEKVLDGGIMHFIRATLLQSSKDRAAETAND